LDLAHLNWSSISDVCAPVFNTRTVGGGKISRKRRGGGCKEEKENVPPEDGNGELF
jgi:hypothetical protein